jgi:hypothetical protein
MKTPAKRQRTNWTVKSKDGRFFIMRSSDGLQVIDAKSPEDIPMYLEDEANNYIYIEPQDVEKFFDIMKIAIKRNQPAKKTATKKE